MNYFESFDVKRKYEDFTNRLQKLVKGYGEIEEIGRIDGSPLFKVVLNPSGTISLNFRRFLSISVW